MRPSLSDTWVRQSVQAVRWVKDNNLVLACSVGMQTWELVAALASMKGVPMRLYVPVADGVDAGAVFTAITRDFNLHDFLTNFVGFTGPQGQVSKGGSLAIRDERIVAKADILIPISIRPGGRMAGLIEQARSGGKAVIDRFQTAYQSRTKPMAYDLSDISLNPTIDKAARGRVIHWTRTANSKWPTERSLDYYRAIATSQIYPRSAFDTLRNIVHSQTIAASSKNMPGNVPVVSLSDLSPVEVIPLMRWRARYRQMSFEPYGIGIERQVALEHGICPVRYYEHSNGELHPGEKIWLSQSAGTKGNWTVEREYRHRGDFNLGAIPRNKLLLLCHTAAEADQIEKETGIRAVSFTS